MAFPVLTTKLYAPPPRADAVARPQLLARLTRGLSQGRRLSLVSAPAGFGKTTLVSAWLASLTPVAHRAPPQVAWLSLDEDDNDPARFLAYLVAALQTVDAGLGQALQAMAATPPPLATAVTLLVNDLAASAAPLVLVLDDYHTISAEVIHRAVQHLIDHRPPTLHLALVTRADPPLSLARWRMRGELTEIRADDLRFSLPEVEAFLADTMGLAIGPEVVGVLEQRTEGWVAGLQLAALSLQGADAARIAAFVSTFGGSHRYVIDYLLDEVMGRQPEHLRAFLYQTAILDRLSAPLCDYVLGIAPGEPDTRCDAPEPGYSQHMLEHLERANLFLVPLDDRREWYRYHHLFADFLRVALRQEPARTAELHRRAALWHERHSLPDGAIAHALAAHDYELAAGLIERALIYAAPWLNGYVTTVLGWLKLLPERTLHTRPRLGIVASRILLLSGQFAAAERAIQEAEEVLRGTPTPEARQLLVLAASYHTVHHALLGEVSRAVYLAHLALSELPEDALFDRARARHGLSCAYAVAGAVVAASQAYHEAAACANSAGSRLLEIYILSELAEVQMVQGRLTLAATTCAQALEVGQVHGVSVPGAGFAQIIRAAIAREQNDLELAERLVQEGLGLVRAGGIVTVWWIGFVTQARVRLARGDTAGALEALAEADQVLQRHAVPRLVRLVAAHRARVWLVQGRTDLAARWAEDDPPGEGEELREFEALTRVRLLLAQARPGEALAALEGLLTAAETAGRMGSVLEMLVLRALALQALGEAEGALVPLTRAVDLAAPEGYVRIFLDEGPRLNALLARLPARAQGGGGQARALLDTLLYDRAPPASQVQAGPVSSAPLAPDTRASDGLLSEQELSVLRLLAEGLSNQAIADRLIIGLGTAKWHVHNLFGKLEVTSRTQAVARARELGLI